jgi:hypothetical protein
MRNNILGLAAAIALCTATINTGATAAYGHGSHSVNGHFRSYFGHGVSRRGIQRHPFASNMSLGTGVAAGGPAITIAAGGPTSTATLPTAATSSAVVNSRLLWVPRTRSRGSNWIAGSGSPRGHVAQ